MFGVKLNRGTNQEFANQYIIKYQEGEKIWKKMGVHYYGVG